MSKLHWPEYLMEAAGLGAFMLSACTFGALLSHPASPVAAAVPDGLVRRALMGALMGLTSLALVYSPWGQQSGAHYNPSVTLAFHFLGKVPRADAALYVLAQFAGGTLGVLVAALALGRVLAHPAVNYVATVPGTTGQAAAFAAELLIAFVMMSVVLFVSNSRRARWTGVCAATLVAVYIAFEAPLSGMSLNPARTTASAVLAARAPALWVYFTAPPLGMLAAAAAYRRLSPRRAVRCAKLHHDNPRRCIFCLQARNAAQA